MTIQGPEAVAPGLLRFARNCVLAIWYCRDGWGPIAMWSLTTVVIEGPTRCSSPLEG